MSSIRSDNVHASLRTLGESARQESGEGVSIGAHLSMTIKRTIIYTEAPDSFDFERVARTMLAVGWCWLPEGRPPNADRLHSEAQVLISKLGTEIATPQGRKLTIREIAAGGLIASVQSGETLLSFEAAVKGKEKSQDLNRVLEAWNQAATDSSQNDPGNRAHSRRVRVSLASKNRPPGRS